MTTILRYPLSQWRGPKTYARRKKEPAAHSAQKVSMNVHIVRNQRENGTKMVLPQLHERAVFGLQLKMTQ